jgi:hypothetical protein
MKSASCLPCVLSLCAHALLDGDDEERLKMQRGMQAAELLLSRKRRVFHVRLALRFSSQILALQSFHPSTDLAASRHFRAGMRETHCALWSHPQQRG